jgi:MFS family permease
VTDAPTAIPGWRALLIATFTIGLTNSVIFVILADLQDEYGFSGSGLGLIAATGFLVALAAQLLIAPYADRGRARRVLYGGLALAVAGSLLFAVSSTLWGFVFARAVVGASVGSFLPAARALAAGVSTAGAGGRLGRLAGVELAGFVSGPVIGGLLVDPLGVSWTFVVFAGIAALSLALLAPRPLPVPPAPTGPAGPRLALDLMRLRAVRIAMCLSLALFLPVGVFDALWDRYLTDRGADNFAVGLSFALYGLPFVVLAAYGGRLAERVGPVRAVLVSFVAIVPLTFSYGLFTAPALIILAGVLEGGVQAIAAPGAQLAVARAAPEGRAAAAQGLAGATQLLGATMAALAAAPIYGTHGPLWVFGLAAGAVALVALTALVLSVVGTRRGVVAEAVAG